MNETWSRLSYAGLYRALNTAPAGTWIEKKSRSGPFIVAMKEFVPTTAFICVGAVGSFDTSPLTDSSQIVEAAKECEAKARATEQHSARKRREPNIEVDSTGLGGG